MLTGTVRKAGDSWTVEHRHSAFDEPRADICAWRILNVRRPGNGFVPPTVADGLVVTTHVGDGAWSAYKDGGYLVLETEHEGTIRYEAIPAPRVRAGIETRYRAGRWEKYSKRSGWVVA